MCGIFLSAEAPVTPLHSRLLCRRGIDSYVERKYKGVTVSSSVLSIRGCVFQPIICDDFLLQFNGEIYNGVPNESDTVFISNIVSKVIKNYNLGCSIILSEDDIPESIDRLHLRPEYTNPFFLHTPCDISLNPKAVSHLFDFVETVYSRMNAHENEAALTILSHDRVFFFRDDVGRRSFGVSRSPFAISSVLYEEELDPLKLYFYDFKHKLLISRFKPQNGYIQRIFDNISDIMPFFNDEKYKDLYSYLVGYDACYVDYSSEQDNVYQIVNTSEFEIEGSPQEDDVEDVCEINVKESQPHTNSQENTVEKSLEMEMMNVQTNSEETEITDLERKEMVELFITVFKKAVSIRLFGKEHVVFFSGGIDSTLMALFVHLVAPEEESIILINTAYPGSFDREVGIASHAALSDRFPERKFVFIENDLSDEKVRGAARRIREVLKPKTGMMHLGIAGVQHFSAICAAEINRVAFVGAGADEAFCGYKKYRLENGVDRPHMLFSMMTMASHNIGRDDRVISDCAVEARFPFLDSGVLELAFSLPDNWLINKEGENKYLLREVLRHYGLLSVADLPKKAMQFGSGISQRENNIWNARY